MTVPVFGGRARDLLVEMGRLRWDQINPDIFGSMFQAVVTPGQRSDLGQHYTSVPNILKTIEPLFLDELKEQFSAGYDSVKKLEALHVRVADIKIFDPACGSGNFLVIAYKELRRLEHAILERVGDLKRHHVLFAESRITIEHFYGIEIDDFAVEVAVLSLWIAKHQMNREAGEKFDVELPLIPLKESGRIVRGNAARLDWSEVCPNDGEDEIYLISNPPYAGSSMQSEVQKEDFRQAFRGQPFSRNLDYVTIWFWHGAAYIQASRAKLAFVTTNSVTQGEHVSLMFPAIFARGIEIGFAYTSFSWANNARGAAGVVVAVIGLRNFTNELRYLYGEGTRHEVSRINPYLADGPTVWIHRRSRQVSDLPPMVRGSQASDNGWLILTRQEALSLLAENPEADRFVRRYVGSSDFINDEERYCLWITDQDSVRAASIPFIRDRLARVATFRSMTKDKTTRDLAERPHVFKQAALRGEPCIIAPSTSSQRRAYIPMGWLPSGVVISNAAYATYGARPWLLGLLTSRIHMAWVRAVAGRMKSDFRYTNTIAYNNFPAPALSGGDKERMTMAALRILDVREYHSEQTLAQLYDPNGMPADLRLAHQQNDELVDSIYRAGGFETDEDRLSHLFAMYEDMTKHEQQG